MRKVYTVNQMVRGVFVQKVERYQKDLLAFCEGRGELPRGNVESLRIEAVNDSVKTMVQGGCDRYIAKRISTNTINDLMYDLMDDGMMKSLQ